MQLHRILETKQANAMKVADTLHNYFRGEVHASEIEALSVYCAYALYKAQQLSSSNLPEIETVLGTMKGNENIYYFLEPKIKEHWKCVNSNYGRFSSESLAEFILLSFIADRGFIEVTPASIISLSLTLLDICDGERVADFGTGTGAFLVNAFLKNNAAKYYGVELDASMSAISSIRAELLGNSVTIEQNDMFKCAEKEEPFDKIFSNYPFGMRLKNMRGGLSYMEKLSETYPNISKATSSDWIFNSLLVSSITDKGKAVGIMTNGGTWNSIDRPIREYFVRRGFIETIIALPEKIFTTTAIPTTLVVFSHRNKRIRMIDAREICQKGRRQNEFSESNIAQIASALTKDSDISKSVDIMEIEEKEYAINPMRYLEKPFKIENGEEFGNVIVSITRGAHFTATQLDEMASSEPTNILFLKLSNIQDGLIDKKLPYLKELDTRYKRYCLKTGDLLISKNGLLPKQDITDGRPNNEQRARSVFASFKIAVADVKANTSIIASTNIYIIRLDESKVNPHYLKAYFESEQGAIALNRIAAGAALPIIGAEQLKKLIIPVPDLETQQKFVERYLAKADEIRQLKYQLEKAQAALKNMFGGM